MFALGGLLIGGVGGLVLGLTMSAGLDSDNVMFTTGICTITCGLGGLVLGAAIGAIRKNGFQTKHDQSPLAAAMTPGKEGANEAAGGSAGSVLGGILFMIVALIGGAAKGCRFGQSMRDSDARDHSTPKNQVASVEPGRTSMSTRNPADF